MSTKLGKMHLWVMWIQIHFNEGPRTFPRGDNYEIAKIHLRNLKISFSRTIGQMSTKPATMHLWVKGIQVCSNEEPFKCHKGDNEFFLLLVNIAIIICVRFNFNISFR